MKNGKSATFRTDEQLRTILHETANWVIHDRLGFAHIHATSLHEALEKAGKLARSGTTVAALIRLPMVNIVVFPPQVDRLRELVTGLKPPPATKTGHRRQTTSL
jgi:hypothetical protein